jgi:hypothetical protein
MGFHEAVLKARVRQSCLALSDGCRPVHRGCARASTRVYAGVNFAGQTRVGSPAIRGASADSRVSRV